MGERGSISAVDFYVRGGVGRLGGGCGIGDASTHGPPCLFVYARLGPTKEHGSGQGELGKERAGKNMKIEQGMSILLNGNQERRQNLPPLPIVSMQNGQSARRTLDLVPAAASASAAAAVTTSAAATTATAASATAATIATAATTTAAATGAGAIFAG